MKNITQQKVKINSPLFQTADPDIMCLDYRKFLIIVQGKKTFLSVRVVGKKESGSDEFPFSGSFQVDTRQIPVG